MYYNLFNQSPTDIHLQVVSNLCQSSIMLQFTTLYIAHFKPVNKSIEQIPESGIAKLKDLFIYNIDSYCQITVQKLYQFMYPPVTYKCPFPKAIQEVLDSRALHLEILI